jgi:hypothetical protein
MLTTNLFAQTRLDNATVEEYLKIQADFYKELCTPGTEMTYNSLLKSYQGDGNYIPTLLDEKIDIRAIKNIIPLIDSKIQWIQSEYDYLLKSNGFSDLEKELSSLKSKNERIHKLKKKYFLSISKDEKETLLEAKTIFKEIQQHLENIKLKAPFMLSFRFPVDHLALRSEYERVKDSNDKEGRARANLIFFFRKIIQDGSLDEDNNKSDANIRAAFDTLYTSINAKSRTDDQYFLTDSERVDLNYVIRNFQIIANNGPEKMLKRLELWANRSKRSREFYQSLLENRKIKISESSQLQDVTSLLESRARALYNLKDFALKNEAKTYEFWSKKSELFQSLFVLETILYSEVGRSDENVGFFRQDVAQVVTNRFKDARFNQIAAHDPLSKYLSKEVVTKNFPWLNVLFKEGEFSFTYFYIPGNLQIYCPDESRVGRFLRKENLKIAMKALKEPREDFQGIRYYSRVSMFGRIAMDSIWKDYTPVGEDPGTLIKRHSASLKKHYENGNFNYHYSFQGTDAARYEVVEIKGTNYVVNPKSPDKFYTYRNPHLFKFFYSTK